MSKHPFVLSSSVLLFGGCAQWVFGNLPDQAAQGSSGSSSGQGTSEALPTGIGGTNEDTDATGGGTDGMSGGSTGTTDPLELSTSTGTTDPSTSTTDTTSTMPDLPPGETTCGDGDLDPGEDCDVKSDLGCPQNCQNVCGDGYVLQGVEECDTGANNGNDKACTSACTPAKCGDGFTYTGIEDCDDKNSALDDGCDAECRHVRLAFVTSELFTGALTDNGGADKICQTAASAANLKGTYRAWISQNNKEAKSHILPHWDNFFGRFVLSNGLVLAESTVKLLEGSLTSSLSVNELGIKSVLPALVWTNTKSDGTLHSGGTDCFNWQAGFDYDGAVGDMHSNSASWSLISVPDPTLSCAVSLSLYCFQTHLPQ